MSVSEILEQAKTLTRDERKELAKLLIDSLDEPAVGAIGADTPTEDSIHWGQNLLRLLDEIGPIELVHPEIEDPVEWVQQIRKEQRQKRLGDWGDDT